MPDPSAPSARSSELPSAPDPRPARPPAARASHQFEEGQAVTHPNFGRGLVVAVDGDLVTVEFAGAERRLRSSLLTLATT